MFNLHMIIAAESSTNYTESFLTGMAIIVSVSLTLLTLLLNKRQEQKKKRNELELYKQMIINWIESSKKDIDNNITAIRFFSEKVKNIETLDIENLSFVNIDFSKIYSLPYEKVADALIVNLKVDNLHDSSKYLYNLMTQLKSFLEFSKQIVDIYKELKADIAQLSEKWNNTFVPLSFNITDNLKIANDKEKGFYQLGKEQFANFNKNHRPLIEDKKGNTNPSLSKCINICVNPLIDYYNRYTEIQSSDIVQKTMQTIHIINCIHNQHSVYMKGYSDLFFRISRNMEISKKELFDAVEFFKDHEIKPISDIRL